MIHRRNIKKHLGHTCIGARACALDHHRGLAARSGLEGVRIVQHVSGEGRPITTSCSKSFGFIKLYSYASSSTFHTLTAASPPTLTTFASPSTHATPFTPSLWALEVLTREPGLATLQTKILVSKPPLTA